MTEPLDHDAEREPRPVRPPVRSPPVGVVGPFTMRHIVLLAATLAIVGALLIALTSPIAGPAAPVAPQPGASFYPIGEAGTGLALGDRPPPLGTDEGALVDLSGAVVDLPSLAGRPVWVVFWATWCPPCQKETPDIQRAWDANQDTGLEILAVNVQETTDVARAYATTYGLTYRIALDPTGGAFRSWGIFGMPTHYFIGRDGRIRDRWFGPLSLDQMQLRLDLIEGT